MVIEFRTKYLPLVYSTQMIDQYGLTPQDYVDDLNKLSNSRYGQGVLFFIVLCTKQQLKPTQVIIATLLVYDFIDHVPQQVSLSICN